MTTVTPIEPETREIETETQTALARAASIVVDSEDTLEEAGGFLRHIKRIRERIAATFKEPIDAAYRAHKATLKARNDLDAPLKTAYEKINGASRVYLQRLEDARRAEEAKRRREAEKAAEDERLRQAEELEKAGLAREAEAVIEAPAERAVFVSPPKVVKPVGMGTRTTWKHEVINVDLVPAGFMMPNHASLAAYARNHKEYAKLPGVRFYPDTTVSTSTQ